MASGGDVRSGKMFQVGLEHHRAGRLREAEAVFRGMLAENPKDVNALHALGLLAAEVGRNDIAAELLGQAAGLLPGNGGLQGELGEVLRRLGRLEAAAAACGRAVELEPGSFGGHYNLGVVLQAQKRYGEAAESYRRAVGIDGKHAGAQYNLGNALKELGRVEEAVGCYQRALELRPGYAEARGNLGLALQMKGDLAGAAACFERVIAERPEDVVGHNSLGNVLREMGQMERALASYQRAVDLGPGDAAARNNLGKLLHDMGRVEEAMGHYELAILAAPERGEAYQNLGMALEKLGRRAEAEKRYRQAMERGAGEGGGVGGAAALYHMAAATGMGAPAAAPAEHVTKVFDEMAETFDVLLLKKLKYQAPQLVHEAVMAAAGAEARFAAVLDLGCGTGLCGRLFRERCGRLVGVDLSAGMVEKARARGGYDELVVGEMGAFLERSGERFDVVIAADVLVYVGDLAGIFAGVSRVLAAGGLFAFTVEEGDGEDYELRRTRRYVHAEGYVRRMAAGQGMAVVSFHGGTLRMEGGYAVAGLIVVLRRENLAFG